MLMRNAADYFHIPRFALLYHNDVTAAQTSMISRISYHITFNSVIYLKLCIVLATSALTQYRAQFLMDHHYYFGL